MLVRIVYCFVVVLILFCPVNGQISKSSLAFVIDRTYSMQHIIDNVIKETDMIFEAVLKSNSSEIEDFILVAFDDPHVELLAQTTDKNKFVQALHSIKLQNGGNCPEYSLSGIETALNFSKPNSFLYVFTNAFAEDYKKIDVIKSLSQEKGIQVNFLLTGKCKKFQPAQYNVYEDITKATSGQIFHSHKRDVKKIINYIIESIKYKRTILKRTDTKEGITKVQFTVDSKIRNVLISLSSQNSTNYTLTSLDGNVIETELIAQTPTCVVGKVILKPGTYTVEINSTKTSSVVISGETTVSFQYGFSITKSATLNETSTKPIDSPEEQYLAIELDNFERDIRLVTAELTDIDDNIIEVLNLTLVNEVQQFYTTESFKPRSGMFKIAINGLTKSNEKIRRVSTSTTQYQNPEIEPVPVYTPPTVTITPELHIIEPDASLSLKCFVRGYPEPEVKWTDDSDEILTPQPIYSVYLRRLYASVLHIKPDRNMTVTCSATSDKGDSNSKTVEIKIKNKIHLKVLEHPEDKNLKYNENATFKCRVDSWPAAIITWFQNKEIISTNENFLISPDNTTLTIKKVNNRLVGKYYVNISNTHDSRVYSFLVKIPSLRVPKIYKKQTIYSKVIGESVNMTCRIIKGEPKPSMTWSFNKEGTAAYKDLKNTQYFYYIEEINVDDSGLYKCKAINDIGKDEFEMKLEVKRPPSVKVSNSVTVKEGERVTLDCIIDGSPKPLFQWSYNGNKIEFSSRYQILNNRSLSFIGLKSISGHYYCSAENSVGKTEENTMVTVYQPLWIEPPKENVLYYKSGENIKLYCNVSGYPIPNLEWQIKLLKKKDRCIDLSKKKIRNPLYVISNVRTCNQGFYSCNADNNIEKKSITYEVYVLEKARIILPRPRTIFKGVVGDRALRVRCYTEGSPEPTITWYKDGLLLAKGEFYDFEGGTLIIKNLNATFQDVYTCNASNPLASDTANIDVIVKDTVDAFEYHSELQLVTERSIREFPCQSSGTSDVRWFKNGKIYSRGNSLIFHGAKRSDSGIYSCRVDLGEYAHNYRAINIIVGSKPVFTGNPLQIVQFKEGATEILDCDARGYPKPSIKWDFDATLLTEKSMFYKLIMTKEGIGKYSCQLRNKFGVVKRSFNIRSEACHLPKNNNYGENMPLLLSKTGNFIDKKAIGLGVTISIYCTDSFVMHNKERLGSYIDAKCLNGTQFLLNNKEYDISKIKCSQRIIPVYYKSKKTCAPGNTELVEVRYNVGSESVAVFEVCIDKDKYKIHFVSHIICPNIANTTLPGATFSDDILLPLKFSDIYNCDSQLKSIYATTGEQFSKDGKCCFGKRQLINPMDVQPGLLQEATYTYLNVVPVWSSCSQENWDEVERRVRSLVYKRDYSLKVMTGSSHSVIIESKALGSQAELRLNDRNNLQQQVPLFLWKIIIDLQEMSSLAIVLINYPNLKPEYAGNITRDMCTDICDTTNWMKNSEWKNPEKGFVFCCSQDEFEKVFNYKYLLESTKKNLIG